MSAQSLKVLTFQLLPLQNPHDYLTYICLEDGCEEVQMYSGELFLHANEDHGTNHIAVDNTALADFAEENKDDDGYGALQFATGQDPRAERAAYIQVPRTEVQQRGAA